MPGIIKQLNQLGQTITDSVGEEISGKILIGQDQLTKNSKSETVAHWVKGTMERMDELVDAPVRTQIMETCGKNCARVNKGFLEKVKSKRNQFKTTDEFLAAEIEKPTPGTRLERHGTTLYQYYLPTSFKPPMRCFCSLLRGLPANDSVSTTYCQCSKGFVTAFWQHVLDQPVQVELIQSVVTGADECKFKIII
jgi:hypothetical protein